MEDSRFDLLVRHAAQHTTRRASLVTLVGGALLLTNQGEGAATDKAKRRRKRKQQQRKRQEPDAAYRDMSAIIDNTLGEAPVSIAWGWRHGSNCCVRAEPFEIQPGERATLNAPVIDLWVWIGNMYWFQFYNDQIQKPSVGIAVAGELRRSFDPVCCGYSPGDTIADDVPMSVNEVRQWWIERRAVFTVTRKPDLRSRKLFELRLPPVVPSGPPESAG